MSKETKRVIPAILTLAGLALFSCGGGGGGSSTSTTSGTTSSNTSTTLTLSGRAIDDVLVGAQVCLDFNGDGICDTKPVFTDGNGYFSLNATGVVTNQTRIIAKGSLPSGTEVILTYPYLAGKIAFNTSDRNIVVSPFTTSFDFFYNNTGDLNSSIVQTKAVVAALTNSSLSQISNTTIAEDYVASSNQTLMQAAQQLGSSIGEALQTVNNTAVALSAAINLSLNETSPQALKLVDFNDVETSDQLLVSYPTNPRYWFYITPGSSDIANSLWVQAFAFYNTANNFTLPNGKTITLYPLDWNGNFYNSTSGDVQTFVTNLLSNMETFKDGWVYYVDSAGQHHFEFWHNADIEHTLFDKWVKLNVANKTIKFGDLFPRSLAQNWSDCIYNANINFGPDAEVYLLYSGGVVGYTLQEAEERPFVSQDSYSYPTNVTENDLQNLSAEQKVQLLLANLKTSGYDVINANGTLEIFNPCTNKYEKTTYSWYIDINGYPHIVIPTTKDGLRAKCTPMGQLKNDPYKVALESVRWTDLSLVPALEGTFDPLDNKISTNGILSVVKTVLTPTPYKFYTRVNTKITGRNIFLNKAALEDILTAVKNSCGW